MADDVIPIFILSLPRSGSTLLQRIIAAHPEVATVSEPWLLLAPMYARRSAGIRAEYSHPTLSNAIVDFIEQLPRGDDDYLEATRRWALDLYRKAGGANVRYFVDKTPRYSLIVDDVIRAFPGGRFIFLWRNPLSVTASVIETWTAGRWNLNSVEVDLYAGLRNLARAASLKPPGSIAVRYEDLVTDPENEVARVFKHLDLDGASEAIAGLASVDLRGRLGDTKGPQRSEAVNANSMDSWKATYGNPIRKARMRRYLDWLGKEHLDVMGYDLKELKASLADVGSNGRWLLSDLVGLPYFGLRRKGLHRGLRKRDR